MTAYAILVAISRYPGLTDLHGPENDAADFCTWLASKDGGGLMLGPPAEFPNPEKCSIRLIRSSDFPPEPNPFRAQPAEDAFREALDRLLFDNGAFRGRVGDRLYLYFAGHGFAGQGLMQSALYTAQARKYDPVNIASTSYAERIVKSNAFDEIVLVMDCCRDVDLFDSISKPTLRLPDRQAEAAAVRFLQAYGAGRGQQARERTMNGEVRGLFTHILLDALRNAKGNEQGEVTGTLLKAYIEDTWGSLFDGQKPYSPDIYLPGGKDIVLTARSAPKMNVQITFVAPPPQGSVIVVTDTDRREVARVLAEGGNVSAQLKDGYYKAVLEGTSRAVFIDVSGSGVAVAL